MHHQNRPHATPEQKLENNSPQPVTHPVACIHADPLGVLVRKSKNARRTIKLKDYKDYSDHTDHRHYQDFRNHKDYNDARD